MPVSQATRDLCAARLLSTLDTVSRVSRPRPVRFDDLPVSIASRNALLMITQD